MTTTQLETGFDRETTAAEVVEGVDLSGRFAIVTGGYSGIGLEMTRALASAGADVLVPARRPDVARSALGPLAEVTSLDLTDPRSIRRFASHLVDRGRPVDVLIHGAGVMRRTRDLVGPGWETHLAVHHLGPHLLTSLVLPVVADVGRVVMLSSAGHFLSDIRWDDLHFGRAVEYDPWVAYGQSKTACALAAIYLDDALAERGGHAFAVHPGSILTPLQREIPVEEQRRLGWIDAGGRPPAGFKNTEQGAATAVWAATSPLLDAHGGAYLQDCNLAAAATSDDMLIGGVKPWAQDRASAERLRVLSEKLMGALVEN